MPRSALSDDTFVAVLLCGGLGGKNESTTPLSTTEWNTLGRSLVRANWRPGDLLRWEGPAAQEALDIEEPLWAKIDALLARKLVVASEIERLAGSGIGVLSRADDEYPSRLRSRLRGQSPPLLFVAGPLALLERGGIAAVGSRNVDDVGAAFARDVGAAAARARTPAISGAARGVDREAMFGALDAGGEAIGIMPDGLTRALRSPDVRARVADGALLVVSPHRPDARFEVWRAMARNRIIYALADVSVVISCDAERGGTWAGARENLKHDWSPLFVRAGDNVPDGNRRLIDLGGMPLYQQDLDATHNGGILTTLLARAEHLSMPEHARTVQQTLIDDPATGGVATRGETPSPGEAGAIDTRSSSSDRGQLNLL